MVGITEVSAAMASLQAGKDMLAAMVGIRDGAKLNETRIALQGVILEAQQGLFAAQQAHTASDGRIAQLEQEIMRLKDWSEEAARYELVDLSGGSFVYMQKPGMRTSEPAHWLCANCFGRRQKSILQRRPDERRPTERQWLCPTCKTIFGASYSLSPKYAELVDES